jgi:type VI protein secretion system component Hcp
MARSSNMFMKIAGVEPSSFGDILAGKDKPIHSAKGWYPIAHWSWGATNHATYLSPDKTSGGRADVQDLMITHDADPASTQLTQMCLAGTKVEALELMCRKPNGEKYIYVKLEKCTVSSVNVGGSDEAASELQMTFGIHYNKVTVETYKGKTIQATWEKAE